MYALFTTDGILYLGGDNQIALKKLEEAGDSGKLLSIFTLDDLAKKFKEIVPLEKEPEVSAQFSTELPPELKEFYDKITEITKKITSELGDVAKTDLPNELAKIADQIYNFLEKSKINSIIEKVDENGKVIANEVKERSLRGLKIIGEKLQSIGEGLKNFSEKSE